MKKTVIHAIILAMALAAAPGAAAQSLGDRLAGIGNALGIIPSKTVDADYLRGVWSYQKPAVAFKSDNFLAKAGGIAAAEKVESELAPYYKRTGFDKMTLTVNSDSTFTMKLARATLTGTITTAGSADDKSLSFSFKAMGVPLGSMTAYVNAESSSVMSLTFDATRLLEIVRAVGAFSGSSSVKALAKLMEQYDGMTAGFRLKKTADAPAAAGESTESADTAATSAADPIATLLERVAKGRKR